MDKFKYLELISRLKHIPRRGWVLNQIPEPETIAGHMYRMALSIFLLPSNFDTSKLIKMALVHDLAESIVGDITPYDRVTVEDKKNRELLAMIEIGKLIPEESKNEIMKLWQEYEDCFTEDS